MRRISCLFLIFAGSAIFGQFGPVQLAFESEVAYPRRMMAGDVNGDGSVDPIVYNLTGSGSIYDWTLSWFPNLGAGQFGPLQVMYTGSLGNAVITSMCDMDNDGDADLVADNNWYMNDGTGILTLVGPYTGAGTAARLLRDIDGDGDVDDVVRSANGLNLLLNNGSGVFSTGPAIGPTGAATSVTASQADINGDGLLDLMIGGDNAQVGWYANLGTGNYGPQQFIADFVAPGKPFCGDVDGDGDVDVIGFGMPGGTIWFANDGSGNFNLGDTIPYLLSAEPQAIADFDGDGDVDFSYATNTSCNVHLLQNQSGVTWTTLVVENVSGYNLTGTSYGIGDLNSDGRMDLLACSGMDIAGWYENLGNGTIGLRKRFCQTMAGGYDISGADIDLDGDLDLVTASYYGDWVCWYANNGDGTFGRQQVVVENKNQIAVSRTADLDYDGLQDIITNDGSCAIIWNNNGGSSWTMGTLPDLGISRCEVDLDADGDLDLIGTGNWYENNGNGQFTVHPSVDLVVGAVKAGDMNGDGTVDLVIGGTVVLSDGTGIFTTVPGGTALDEFSLGDLDGDMDVDILEYRYGYLVGYYNNGVGNMTIDTLSITPLGMPRTLILKDINGDSFLDAVWALSNGYTHQTYYNLNLGNGQLGNNTLIDPTAESAAAMIYADVNNDAVPDLVTARFRTISWQQNHFFDAFRFRGSVFMDYDLNATLDPTDHKVPFRLVRTDASNVLVWTNSLGEYDLPADTGSWNVWHTPPSIYQVTNDPDTLNATLTLAAPIATGLDIGLAPIAPENMEYFSITHSGPFRCNSEVMTWIQLRNTGTSIPEGIILDYEIHPDLSILGAWPPPDSIVGQHYFWSVDSLGWFQEFFVQLTIQVGPVGTMQGFGYTLTSSDLSLNYSQPLYAYPVVCAFDPNDKLVTPQGYGATGAVDIDTEWLEYTVRFQNTGTDTAFTVQLLDTLDADLDPLTMEVLASSHELTRIQVDEDRVALFRYERILLPDSNVNEAGSNGFVKYRIKPNAGSPHLTEIMNTAAIYFDLNEPVITNTTLNTLVDCNLFAASITDLGSSVLEANASDSYQWFLNGNNIPDATEQQFTATETGMYAVQATSEYGCVATSEPYQVIVMNVRDHDLLGVTVTPNPFNARTRLDFNEVLTKDHMIDVIDASGRVLRTLQGNGTSALVLERGELSVGLYMVRVSRAGKVLNAVTIAVE
ncbi:MAG: T9SS type A sorting domain-containing protein [Flavobacteriales bacterium]|nr:T9SS type A sorting domain-containing protein [Flavobacteriales bacterium]